VNGLNPSSPSARADKEFGLLFSAKWHIRHLILPTRDLRHASHGYSLSVSAQVSMTQVRADGNTVCCLVSRSGLAQDWRRCPLLHLPCGDNGASL